jgi:hypothetical protein
VSTTGETLQFSRQESFFVVFMPEKPIAKTKD